MTLRQSHLDVFTQGLDPSIHSLLDPHFFCGVPVQNHRHITDLLLWCPCAETVTLALARLQ